MKRLIKNCQVLGKSILDFLFPRYCIVCSNRLAIGEARICCNCLFNMPLIRHASFTHNPVARTFWGLIPVERGTSFMHYTKSSPYTRILFLLKYQYQPEIGLYMGRIMAKQLLPKGFFADIDVLVPVPLAKEKEKERGYNQSLWIAKGVSEVTGIPIDTTLVKRTVSNRSQTTLNESERRTSVIGIFKQQALPGTLDGKHLLLVDDVMTTGATILACAESICKHHHVHVSVLTLAYSQAT